jgi:hypothetical protein
MRILEALPFKAKKSNFCHIALKIAINKEKVRNTCFLSRFYLVYLQWEFKPIQYNHQAIVNKNHVQFSPIQLTS